MMKRRKAKIAIVCVALLFIATLITWIEVGIHVEWGPFSFLAFDAREKEIVNRYDVNSRQGEIIFYGASNFRLWEEMEEDMAPFIVQNHGFGGSTDQDLMERADTLLYPYNPAVVVFQTGSNDYAKLSGDPDSVVEQVLERKASMFSLFHKALPDAKFVVISGILMPGRSQFDEIVKKVNAALQEYCEATDYMYFVDAEEMTVDANGNHLTEMFVKDGIHLTHEARIIWANDYIKPVLDQVTLDHPELSNVKS